MGKKGKNALGACLWLLPIGIGLDVLIGQLVVVFELPIYLDKIGTVFSGILGGPWIGLSVGVLSSLANGFFSPVFMPFLLVGGTIGLTSGILSQYKMFDKVWKIFAATVIIICVAIIVETPIVIIQYGGITGSGSTYLTTFLMAAGWELLPAAIVGDSVSEIIDKGLTVIVAYVAVMTMHTRTLMKFACGDQFIKFKRN